MSEEWIYKATDKLAPLSDTKALALQDGFLCKAAYERGDKKVRADFVKAVHRGHIIHFYFRNRKDPAGVAHVIGSFEVTDNSSARDRFTWPTENTDLVTVKDPVLIRRLKSLGYEDDPQLRVMTGWALRPANRKTPRFSPEMFPGRQVFRRWP